jgi:crotonobetainyl-CoA:carnitine CoA-transferase CaiB-like acyl-CoA transferase
MTVYNMKSKTGPVSSVGMAAIAQGKGTLAGIRVLDLTQALAGPFCTQILADHGADVVKIEPLVSGDMARLSGPFHPDDIEHLESGYFHSINRNKRSVTIDLKTEEGRDLLLRMVTKFDILVENFRAGVMDRLGLSYEEMRKINPRLVYGTIRGFGDPRSGRSPYSDWPAFDVVAQAMGGMIGVTGLDPEHPVKVGPGVGDTVPALYLTIGLLAAVLRARETGQGQFVDVAMVDAILAVTERIVHQKSFGKTVGRPDGNHHPFVVPFGIFAAGNGHVALACHNDTFFGIFCKALDATHLLEDPLLATKQARLDNKDRSIAMIEATTRRFTKAELKERLGGKVPFGPVYQMDEIEADPHFAIRNMILDLNCPPIRETVHVAGCPIKFSETPGVLRGPGPRQGEHTQEVLLSAGLTVQETERLRSKGIIS